MLILLKTKHSDFVRNILKTGKGLNMTPNKFFILKEMVRQSYDPEQAKGVMTKWEAFEKFMKNNRLTVSIFALAYLDGKYRFRYHVESNIHNNPAFVVSGELEDHGIPFNFVPQYFATWLNQILDAVPYSNLIEVAQGG